MNQHRELLRVQNLAVGFRTRAGDAEVCSDVTLGVAPGETLAVIGESGSGKTVTALTIVGLLGPGGVVRGGRIEYDGRDITRLTGRERRALGLRGPEIGMIFQNPALALDPVFTVGHQLAEALTVGGRRRRSSTAVREEGIEWLRKVGLPDPEQRWSAYPHQLSGGQKQRAMIAIALAPGPRLLIADEPTTALDVTIQAQVLRLLRSMQRDLGLSMLLVTHDFGVVAAIADRVAVMYAGMVVETGTVGEVITDPQHPYTRALLASVPTGVPGAEVSSLPGSVPSAPHMPSGCRFHPRCPVALPECAADPIPVVALAPDRTARCVLAHPLTVDTAATPGGAA